jgi:hypothetical protein
LAGHATPLPHWLGQPIVPPVHAWHTPLTQACAEGQLASLTQRTVQPMLASHCWHVPFTHTSPLGQMVLGPHMLGHPLVPGTHAAWQVPLMHESRGSLQAASVPIVFAQHAWPALPHWGAQLVPARQGWQRPLRQLSPAGHVAPFEQVCWQLVPVALQAMHWPFAHSWPCGHWLLAEHAPTQVPPGVIEVQPWHRPFAQISPAAHWALSVQPQVVFEPQPGALH